MSTIYKEKDLSNSSKIKSINLSKFFIKDFNLISKQQWFKGSRNRGIR